MSDPHAVLEVEDINTFDVLANPIRVRMLRHLAEPISVKTLAERLDVPPTRLYHHINSLAAAGIVEVVETRKVGAMTEKLYQRTAGRFLPSAKLFERDPDPKDLARMTASLVFDPAAVDIEALLVTRLAAGDENPIKDVGVSRSVVSLLPEDVEQVVAKLEEIDELLASFNRKTEGVEYGFSFAFVPVARS